MLHIDIYTMFIWTKNTLKRLEQYGLEESKSDCWAKKSNLIVQQKEYDAKVIEIIKKILELDAKEDPHPLATALNQLMWGPEI